jgi:hypothetical protein
MSLPILEAPPNNRGWSIKKTARTSTIVAGHTSGREVRVSNWAYPLYSFELTFPGLASNAAYPGLGRNSLQRLMALFNQVAGQAGTFLFTDPTDSYAAGAALGTGDGSTVSWPFMRTLANGGAEPVGYVAYVAAVYLAGVPQTGNWSLANPSQGQPYPMLTLASPPSAGQRVSADFNWCFVCRFDGDNLEFEQFMDNLWQCQSVKFQSVRNGGF